MLAVSQYKVAQLPPGEPSYLDSIGFFIFPVPEGPMTQG